MLHRFKTNLRQLGCLSYSRIHGQWLPATETHLGGCDLGLLTVPDLPDLTLVPPRHPK